MCFEVPILGTTFKTKLRNIGISKHRSMYPFKNYLLLYNHLRDSIFSFIGPIPRAAALGARH